MLCSVVAHDLRLGQLGKSHWRRASRKSSDVARFLTEPHAVHNIHCLRQELTESAERSKYLAKRIAKLEEANARLETDIAEMRVCDNCQPPLFFSFLRGLASTWPSPRRPYPSHFTATADHCCESTPWYLFYPGRAAHGVQGVQCRPEGDGRVIHITSSGAYREMTS
jgi:hypothetical protein